MDTKLVNSRLLARRDVRVWFFESGREFAGPATCVAENGVVFNLQVPPPKGADPLSWLDEVRQLLKGRKVSAELTSPKIRIEARLDVLSAKVASSKTSTLSVTAVFVSPPDPKALKVLLEPSIVQRK